jgi:hypothetical protein
VQTINIRIVFPELPKYVIIYRQMGFESKY